MKRVALLVFLFCATVQVQAVWHSHPATTNTARVVLKPLNKASRGDGSLSMLSAKFEVAKTQRAALGGIRFTFTLTNTGRQAVTINNPLEFIRIYLRDRKGRVTLPQTVPRGLRCSMPPQNSIQTPFKLRQVSLNGMRLTKQGMERYGFHLAAGGSLRVSAEIDQILKGWKRDYPAPPPPPPIKISPGEYTIPKVTLLLSKPQSRTSHTSLSSQTSIKVILTKK